MVIDVQTNAYQGTFDEDRHPFSFLRHDRNSGSGLVVLSTAGIYLIDCFFILFLNW